MLTGQCVDCGAATTGTRCRVHNGAHQAIAAALALADVDRALLTMRKEEKLSADRIAVRLGVSRNRVYQRLSDARRREKIRERLAA